MSRSRKNRVGEIVMIPIEEGNFAFGQVLKEPLVAFFDVTAKGELPIETILRSRIIFAIWVMNRAISKGGWRVIGHADVPPGVDQSPPFFKKDAISGNLSITLDGSEEIPATRDEVSSLERAAAWEADHVAERL